MARKREEKIGKQALKKQKLDQAGEDAKHRRDQEAKKLEMERVALQAKLDQEAKKLEMERLAQQAQLVPACVCPALVEAYRATTVTDDSRK